MFKFFGKRILFFIVFFGFLVWGFGCQGVEKSYYYDLIEIDIQINQDSTFDVVEKQTYNLQGSFGYFYRDIELRKLDHISALEVFDDQGRRLSKEEYKLSYKGNQRHIEWNFPRRDFDNELKSWTIKYKVHGGLGFFDNYDELYWNAIFPDRDVNVKEAEVIVHLSKEVARDQIKARLFIGKLGSTTESKNYQIIDGKTVKFWGENIKPMEYLTLVATWPKGIVEKPFIYRNQFINWLVLLIALALPIFVFIRSYIIWRKKGRDPKIKKTIIAHYSPPENLPPAVVGVLINQKVQMKDIIATVVDLAVRGYLRIREEEKSFFRGREYIFEKLKEESDLKPFEQETIRGLFGNKKIVSSKHLKNKFYKKIPGIKKVLHQEVSKTDFFIGNIQDIRKKYKTVYGIILVILFLAVFGSLFIMGFSGVVERYFIYVLILGAGLAVSAIIGMIFAHYMPSLTSKGLEAKWKALGFKEYLHTAERFRIGAETLKTFSKFLPYAMIFGVEKQWAKRFSDFSYQEQGWYASSHIYGGRGGMPASFSEFSSSFSSFADSISSTFGSRPGGSGMGAGGGGAGGGGGGGGGGAG